VPILALCAEMDQNPTRGSTSLVTLWRGVSQLIVSVPAPVKTVLKALGFDSLLFRLLGKSTVELAFQVEWAKEFAHNKSKVLEYWTKYRYLDEIIAACGITDDTRILDVGCGISTVLHYLPGDKFGVDPLAVQYMKLYDYPEDMIIQKAYGEDLLFPDEHFDVVFCSNVLDHVTDPQRTVAEIYRVLRMKGYFALTVELFVGEDVERDPAHPHSLTVSKVYSLLEGRFEKVLERESPWIGLKGFVRDEGKTYGRELIAVLRKV
jgi:SAM-dependent methyltransferase